MNSNYSSFSISSRPAKSCDVVIVGGGIAGLWILNLLIANGFSAFLVDSRSIGGTQTSASQGMIHGGQRYLLGGNSTTHAEGVAGLPPRWTACLNGYGEIDLREVRILSPTQLMWPAGGALTNFALGVAVQTLSTKTRKLDECSIPFPLAHLVSRPIFELPEMVLDIESLTKVLAAPHWGSICMGKVEALEHDGRISISGRTLSAQLIICAAGLGNEELLSLLEPGKCYTQRRPIRQIMVRTMPFPLYGHGVTTGYKPRITVTSHPLPSGGFVWYLGGAIADKVLSNTEDEAIAYAKAEMLKLFGHLDWTGKEWATWIGTRAEPLTENGRLPDGPVIKDFGSVLFAWPTKLTLTPRLGDQVIQWLVGNKILPKYYPSFCHDLNLPTPPLEPLPWKSCLWKN